MRSVLTLAALVSLASLAALAPAAPVQDDGPRILPPVEVWPPRPIPRRPLPLVLESLRVKIAIANATATTELEQAFRNRNPFPVEDVYVWPLPDEAVVSQLELWVDGKPQQAELLDKDKARGIYEDIVRRRQDPALLEWIDKRCVKVSVFPVPANGESRVRIRYANAVPASAGTFEYTLPLRLSSVAPGGLASFVLEGTLEATQPLSAIHSPTHPLDVRHEGSVARFSMEQSGVRAERDLQLLYSPTKREFGALPLAHRKPGEDGFFSITLAPRFDLSPAQIQAKDVVFVLDTSGSMAGEKMEQARRALEQCVGRLRPEDRFSLVRFSTEAEAFRTGLLAPTAENLAAAREWIAKLEARGGTNIDEALAMALRTERAEGRLCMVFFLTDGLPTVGEVAPEKILARAKEASGGKLRVFTFGVGFDVNTKLLDALSETTRGDREYVRPEEDVEIKVSSLFDKVASPVLTDVKVALDGADAYDVYPRELPDVFRGSQLLVAGRYRGQGMKTLRLTGNLGSERREWTWEVDLPGALARNDALRPLWASRKVGFLLDQIRIHGSNAELVEEVKRLGREFAIVTPYTSFLVVEEGARLSQARGLAPVGGGAVRFRRAQGEDDSEALRRLGYVGDDVLDVTGANGRAVTERLDELERDVAADARDRLADLPATASGEGAVEASKEAKAQTAAPSAPATSGMRPGNWLGAPGASVFATLEGRKAFSKTSEIFVRTVGTKVFHFVGSTWVDAAFQESDRGKLVKIEFLSDQYFDLLRREPDLARFLALGSRLVVAWKGVVYEIG